MSEYNRLDMLKEISLFDKYDDMSIFKSYIPDHYDEIYSLYTLLEKAKVRYKDIKFNEPLENSGSFIIRFECNNIILNKIEKFLEENKTIKYLRKRSFSVDLSYNNVSSDIFDVEISFNKDIKEE